MSADGWYYLHANGELIHKGPHTDVSDFRESTFVRAFWPIDVRDREGAWTILVEARAGGANGARIAELAEKWHCDDADAVHYAQRVNCTLSRDGDSWMAAPVNFENLQESPAGFGDTCLEAMAELCKALGYRPATMWGPTFKGLLAGKAGGA